MPLLLPSGIIPYEDNFLPDIVDEELSPLGWHRVTQLPDDAIVHERSRFLMLLLKAKTDFYFTVQRTMHLFSKHQLSNGKQEGGVFRMGLWLKIRAIN